MSNLEGVMAVAKPWGCPPLQNVPILGEQYTSREFFDHEWSSMWTKVWLLMGRSSEMQEPGSYQVEEVGPESFIMIRQADSSIRAFYNVCQHRGSRLIFNKEGTTDKIVCPYHGWEWASDGSLEYVQDPEDFKEGNPCDDLTLVEVNC
ncbi:MAG: Rieske (2Fe-2S) protein, partial [Actinomycetota bacterium]|nr:Rieske (2Fe-2S) protein [Actinomycetota bacterium]